MGKGGKLEAKGEELNGESSSHAVSTFERNARSALSKTVEIVLSLSLGIDTT